MASGPVDIRTLASTDQGVGFIVEVAGKRMLHLGDLHDWRWPGESVEWNIRMQQAYYAQIAKIADEYFDIVFVPLDPRQEQYYCLGMDYLWHHLKIHWIFPMHFARDTQVVSRYYAQINDADLRAAFMVIQDVGQSFCLEA